MIATANESIVPRPYQQKAIDSTLEAFERGEPGAIIRLPTGAGKTITDCLIAQDWLNRSPYHRVMCLLHEATLVNQWSREIYDVLGIKPAIEQASKSVKIGERPRIVVASRASLAERVTQDQDGNETRASRLGKFDQGDHWLVIVDEGHKYARGLKICGHIFEHFEQNPQSRRLGITATPWRTDKLSLESLFPHIASDYRLMDPTGGPCAVNDGWCVDYEQIYVQVEGVDFKTAFDPENNVKGRQDWRDDDVARILTETKTLAKFIEPALEQIGERRALIFSATVAMAQAVSDYINAKFLPS